MPLDPETAWDAFLPFEAATTIPAGVLVDYAEINAGAKVLDVGCGTGVVSVTAARRGAIVSALDPSKALLQRAKENSKIADVSVEWREGLAESMPFENGAFDVVLSQFGHMFSPNPDAALLEMLRVLKPGGRFVVSVWDHDHFIGRVWKLLAQHGLEGFSAPITWGKPEERSNLFEGRLENIQEKPGIVFAPCLSPAHTFGAMSKAIWPLAVLLDQLAGNTSAIEALKRDFLALIAEHVEGNAIPQRYTLVSGRKPETL